MAAHYIIIFFLITSLIQSTTWANPKSPDFIGKSINRRILHQPLFPTTSAPPPETELLPPPPQPDTSALPEEDHPFSNELPSGPGLIQWTPPPPPVTANNAEVAKQNATWQPYKPIKKAAIAITSVILILAAVSAFAFCLHKKHAKQPDESRKLVGVNSQRVSEEEDSNTPPSQPPSRNTANEINGHGGSPYRKLSVEKRFDQFGSHLDLQPVPPVVKATPQMLSSYDEGHENVFLAPKGSFVSNKSPTSSLPRSKRTSPKSRFSTSSPDAKPVMKPSIKQSMPPSPPPPPPTSSSVGPPQPSKTLSYDPKGANLYKIPNPPPLPLSMPRKSETFTSLPVSKQLIRPQSNNYSPKATPVAEKTSLRSLAERDVAIALA